jgi:DNA-binding XRE family transcriptional regulator
MSVLTRERGIKHAPEPTTVIRIIGPSQNHAKVLEAVRALGFVKSGDAVPWEEVFPESSPGTRLAGARYKEALTQRQLAQATGIPQRHISEMENNKRVIGVKRAKILGKTLKIDYRVFL